MALRPPAHNFSVAQQQVGVTSKRRQRPCRMRQTDRGRCQQRVQLAVRPQRSATWQSAGKQPGLTIGYVGTAFFWTRIIPVPTCKLGKKRMIDLAVLWAFFEAKRAEG